VKEEQGEVIDRGSIIGGPRADRLQIVYEDMHVYVLRFLLIWEME